jgi:arylsulfatase A-like enzyme
MKKIINIIFSFFIALFANSQNKPNIILILADDLGYGDLSCYGASLVKTPNIDRLAKEGIRFTNAYSPHSVCTPSRYALMTGQYAWRTWNGHQTVWSNDPLIIDTARMTLPKMLKSVGYKTAIIGKWHLGFGTPGSPGWDDLKGPDYNKELRPGPLEVGFDYFWGIPHVGQKPHVFIENHHVIGVDKEKKMEILLDKKWNNRISYIQRIGVPDHDFIVNESVQYDNEKLAVILTEKAVNWIEKQNENPFFLYFAHRNVHGPITPSEKFKGTSNIGVYGDFINELDWSVGEIVNVLKRKGLLENTIILFSSDNGGVRYPQKTQIVDYNGHKPNGPFSGQKGGALEGGVHVPLIVRWPGTTKSESVSQQLVALSDVFATFADYYNISLPYNAGEDSFSFLNELKEKKSHYPSRQSVVVDSKNGIFAIRKGPWKFIAGQTSGGYDWDEESNIRMITHKWDYMPKNGNPPGQLYNLANDSGETINLYDSHPEIVIQLRDILREIQYSGRSHK